MEYNCTTVILYSNDIQAHSRRYAYLPTLLEWLIVVWTIVKEGGTEQIELNPITSIANSCSIRVIIDADNVSQKTWSIPCCSRQRRHCDLYNRQ